jgi:NAD(P)-dependent dehydrogenase (short-subunit alcohol dehydrogenase family)
MSKKRKWTADDIPDQTGRIAIVTGANSGIGYETALALADHGATVIMACRNLDRGSEAADQIRQSRPAGDVVVKQLDLGDLDSVSDFASEFKAKYDRLDLLINNAGVMVPPYGKTAQGFETQLGVNHLGHFALTGQLLDLVLKTTGSRIVTVSSVAHRFGEIDFNDLQWENRSYSANAAYGQSKLANLLFTYELQRKLDAANQQTLAAAAHPGWTSTNLQQHSLMARVGNRFLAQSPPMGALPTLYAATALDVRPSGYYGPMGLMEMRGYPQEVESNDRSRDETVAERLWGVSEELTGIRYAIAEN